MKIFFNKILIVIKWPSGMTQELARVKPNQVLTIIEPEKP